MRMIINQVTQKDCWLPFSLIMKELVSGSPPWRDAGIASISISQKLVCPQSIKAISTKNMEIVGAVFKEKREFITLLAGWTVDTLAGELGTTLND